MAAPGMHGRSASAGTPAPGHIMPVPPSAGGAAGPGANAAAPASPSAAPLRFSPAPGVLPEVVFWPVHVMLTSIGGRATKLYHCEATGSLFAVCGSGVDTQAGCIKVAARAVVQADGSVAFRLPYEVVAIKRERKDMVQRQQHKLQMGFDGDNSMLNLALLVLLQATSAADYVCKLLESWHDDAHLYTVLEYMPEELRARYEREPAGCLDESLARGYVGQAMQALRVLHAYGWCHRDISPENMMVSSRNTGVLIDFGTAALMRAAPATSPTAASGRTRSAPSSSAAGDYVGVSSPAASPSGSLTDRQPSAISAPSLHSPSSSGSLVTAKGSSLSHELLAAPPDQLGGFSPLAPPPPKGAFCKRSYADPCYIYHKPYYGIAFDLWSIAQVLYCIVSGSELYREPVPGVDRGFTLLWETEAAMVVSAPTADNETGITPLSRYLAQQSFARAAEGKPAFSAAFCDLLGRLFRLRPAFRPLNVDSVLKHPWFTGIPFTAWTVIPPADGRPHQRSLSGPTDGRRDRGVITRHEDDDVDMADAFGLPASARSGPSKPDAPTARSTTVRMDDEQ